jgi:hypothetical protein
VHILHIVDDFLAERKSIEALKETLGDQVTLYPYGGHLGNLWYPENKKTVLRILPSMVRQDQARQYVSEADAIAAGYRSSNEASEK